MKYLIYFLFTTIIFFSSCAEGPILKNKNFDDGNWLLVIENSAKNELFVIDDEEILKNNPEGIFLSASADCHATTCDGFVELYKDGELISELEYLSSNDLIESKSLKTAHKKAIKICLDTSLVIKNRIEWDSISRLKTVYRIMNREHSTDINTVCFYKYE